MCKVKFSLNLQLKTSLHVGSGLIEDALGASNIIKNGNGEYIVPGTSIAGLFFNRLDIVLSEIDKENTMYKRICHSNEKDNELEEQTDRKSFSSPYEFSTYVFDKSKIKPAIRDRVKINRSRKTAEDGAKFSHWEIEPFDFENKPILMNWEMTLNTNKYLPQDFDLSDSDSILINNEEDKWDVSLLQQWAERVFKSWKQDGLFVGAFSTSGCGWVDLIDYHIKPDTEKNDLGNSIHIEKIFKEIPLKIIISDESDGYGTNSLLIRGGEAMFSLGNKDDIEPDAVFMNNGSCLFIPGSSIKGVLTAFLEKYGHNDWNKSLFGQTEDNEASAGKIYIPDLYPENFDPQNLAVINRHAQDEFTRAVLGSSKFDEEALFLTTFSGIIKILKTDWNDEMNDMLNLIHKGMQARVISLGAHSAYPVWEMELNHE